MVEVTVSRLGLDSTTNSYVVILRERGGRRLLPIWIGQPEAESIVMHMNDIKRERPITHDLCKALIVGLGGTLRRVTITHVQKNTYFATMHVDGPAGLVEVDARPSDSIAIALRCAAPIFAPELLLTAVEESDADEDEGTGAAEPPSASELSADELKRYLGSLRPEDFGRFTP
ncbi:MAG: bifunctional nuclease family protein [Gemmatimonadaceae bacterium]|nr:bifunctional nuclease family protein [Gemmatimonadaceae bacterium]